LRLAGAFLRYAMLLNESLKEHRKMEEMQEAISALAAQLQEQTAQIQKVSAQLQLTNRLRN